MKYKYLSGRSVMPNGVKSIVLKCYECKEIQSRSYRTECGRNICYSCKRKDEEGLLEFDNLDKEEN